MNQQTITAFKAFDNTLSNAIRALHETLQQTDALTDSSMYATEFNDILSFQEKNKEFTRFLNQQSESTKRQYHQFRASQKQMNGNKSHTLSSQISIQSTPQSLDDWSYNTSANDGGSLWRGYNDSQSAYNSQHILFSDADIDMIPYAFKVIDTDNDSEYTENIIVPSLPPSISIDDTKEIEEESYILEDDIADTEDDEKWDSPLIKTIAFAGFFDTAPTAFVEFKNDNVVKPQPPKWQEREEENKWIINCLAQEELFEDIVDTVDAVDAVDIVEADVEISTNTAANGEECMCSNDNGMKRRRSLNIDGEEKGGLLSHDVVFNIKETKEPPPIAFIEYERPKENVEIEKHPHYHPLVHGEEGFNEEETMSGFRNDYEFEKQSAMKSMYTVNDSINGLRYALDHHFNRNHNDFSDIKHALYSLRGYYSNYNEKKKNGRNQDEWRTRKKNMEHR